MSTVLVALLLAIGGGHGDHIVQVVPTDHGTVVMWDSPAPGEGWVWVETTKRGALRIDIQQENVTPAP